jgi:short-subunit dehydrogenase
MIELDGKVVILTGASSGIGAALAPAFSKKGARVTLTARRLEHLKETARNCPGETLIIPGDLLQEDDRGRVVRKTRERWGGKIDILINNAGMGMYGPFLSTTEGDWRRIFEINLFSIVFLTQAILPIMQDQGEGLIINMGSIGGLLAHSDKVTPYVASKHALIGFSRGLAKDVAETGVRILAVCPHLTATEFFTVSPGAEEMASEVDKYRHVMDSPEAVAQGILDQLDSRQMVVCPTAKPARAYEKQKDL